MEEKTKETENKILKEEIENTKQETTDSQKSGFDLQNIAKLDRFLEKESLNSLLVCIILVVAMTQMAKSICPSVNALAVVTIFSAITSYSRMLLNNHLTQDNLIERIVMATINIIPIAFGSVGSYDLIVHNILKNVVIKL